jgi:signal transduction histidine kinase
MPKLIAKRLEENIERILMEWEQRVLAEIPSAINENQLTLRDFLPEYLAELVDALSKTIDRTEARKKFDKAESTRVSKKHGQERFSTLRYTMDEMIFEYHILRRVLCDVLEEEAPLNDVEREIIVCSIEQAVNDAATEFSNSLKYINTQLSEEKNLRDKFVASLSHDLRTPLTSIKIVAQILAKKIQSHEEIKKASQRIVTAVDRVDTMIQDLLDFTHFRVGEKLPFNPSLTNLNKIVQASVNELNVIHGKLFVFIAAEEFEVFCDPSAITRIIENLGSNAVKYGLKSAPITVKLEKSDKCVKMSMHNFGKPIDSTDLNTIFEPFKRTESAEQGPQKGWGIGLPLVKAFAEAHEGNVKVESSSEGTTFSIYLPGPIS